MKYQRSSKVSRRTTDHITPSRWAAYAAAGAASAIGGAASAEANIAYSGPIDHHFSGNMSALFPLAGPGNFLVGYHHLSGDGVFDGASFALGIPTTFIQGSFAGFTVHTSSGGSFGGQYGSKLRLGQSINPRPFVPRFATLASDGDAVPNARWQTSGTGFLGFRFNGAGGVQYGWVRLNFTGGLQHDFTLIDYAFAGPGERIRAGQTTESVPDSGGWLGLLALGCAGLLAGRAARRDAAVDG